MCIIAVAVAVFFNIFLQSMTDGKLKSIEAVVRTFDTGHVNVASKDFDEEIEYLPVQYPLMDGRDSDEIIREIKRIKGVEAVFPRIAAYATLQDSVIKHALLWGINIDEEMALNDFNIIGKNNGLVSGRYPRPGAKECAIGVSMARKTGLSIGDRIPLKVMSAQFSDKFWDPEITGIFQFDYRKYDEGAVVVSFDRLRQLLLLGEGTQQLLIYADNEEQTSVIAHQIRQFTGEGTMVREWADNSWVAAMLQLTRIISIIAFIFQLVASFLIINTVLTIIQERIKEIGMMGSLGMSRREVITVFFFEAVILSAFGALAGCILGGAASWTGSVFNLGFLQGGSGDAAKDSPLTGAVFFDFSWITILRGFFFGVIVSSICTFIPSLKSAFVEPVEALRN
jgi:putative ABC transport system permease protein